MPSTSVTAATRDVKPARCLSPPPPDMNRNVTPFSKRIARLTWPPRDPSPVLGNNAEKRLASKAGSRSSVHLSLAICIVGMPITTVSWISNR